MSEHSTILFVGYSASCEDILNNTSSTTQANVSERNEEKKKNQEWKTQLNKNTSKQELFFPNHILNLVDFFCHERKKSKQFHGNYSS